MQYIAFLRGINVGGNKKVPMVALKKVFEAMGCTNVSTILNSGNVIFEHPEKDVQMLTEQIEKILERTFGFHIGVILRTSAEIQTMVDAKPFKNMHVAPNIRLYVTFTTNHPREIYTVVDISNDQGTTEDMKNLEKQFGKQITTRNWNTILKLIPSHQTIQ